MLSQHDPQPVNLATKGAQGPVSGRLHSGTDSSRFVVPAWHPGSAQDRLFQIGNSPEPTWTTDDDLPTLAMRAQGGARDEGAPWRARN